MRLAVLLLGALLGLLAAQGTGNDCPHKKSATLLPSFTVTPTATESTGTTSHRTTKSHKTTTHRTTTIGTTSHGPTTATHNPTTTRHGNVTVHPTSNSTATHSPATTSHGNATVHPSNSTTTSPGFTSSAHPGPPPPSPSPSPASRKTTGDYMWTNGSQPCVHLQAQIQIRVKYTTQGGGEAWGVSVLNPNKTKAEGSCEDAHPHLLLSFPYGQLSFGFMQDLQQRAVYLSYMAMEYNVTFPQAAQWTFSAQNASLRDLQAPLGQSFSCGNSSIILSPAVHLDLLSLRVQAAQLPHTGVFGPSFSCPSDGSILLPLIIGLIFLGLLALVLIAFCISRRRPSAYQPL
ncbi:macrosialin [Saimiri boliviensis]|uniref:Macrosialin n=1 Tax=Saimiri boliviensis boliviensis TaxID=39432 RepID=A0A2K6UJL9_SAIBB|nr:macrosialin [Saimiri boliviensis boliviensis]